MKKYTAYSVSLINFETLDVKTVEDGCSKLAAFYHADLAEQDLISECKHFKHHIYCWHQNEVPHPTI